MAHAGAPTYRLEPAQSDVVCFESLPAHSQGQPTFSSTIQTHGDSGVFPPNTLFRLKSVIQPGEWVAPGGTRPRQRLLVVTAVFKTEGGAWTRDADSKFVGSSVTFTYGGRDMFVKGIDDVIKAPVLRLVDEFTRDFTWHDWKNQKYSLKEEWHYVNGCATTQGCTAGARDLQHIGMEPRDFLAKVNAYIRARRDQGCGDSLGDEFAFLTTDEVLAVRLFTGPAYQPICDFLRQVSKLSSEYRTAMSTYARLTFSATVGHLCSAIRKIAAVATVEEMHQPLFRGARGDLTESFWVKDKFGQCSAVDASFMSTTRQAGTTIAYMSREMRNVLWKIRGQSETGSGYHFGADLSMLSQFAAEKEIVFPPCTMLQVTDDDIQSRGRAEHIDGVEVVTIEVLATFV